MIDLRWRCFSGASAIGYPSNYCRHRYGSRVPGTGRAVFGIEQGLQTLVERTVADDGLVRGVALQIDSPALGLEWSGAAGFADPENRSAMTAARPVRIASNTKTYVAAAVLQLVEDGRLGIDDPIAMHLPDETVDLLISDGYDPESMTIRHLLTHTSGLYDHSDSQNYGDAILADPQRRWTRAEQVEAAIAWGDPWGPREPSTPIATPDTFCWAASSRG